MKRPGGPAASLFSLGRPWRLAAIHNFASRGHAVLAIGAHTVEAGPTRDHVSLSRAAVDHVVPATAADVVLAVAAVQMVGPRVALEIIVAGVALLGVVAG